MLSDTPITKENLDTYLRELGKVFRKRNGTAMPAEMILIGGASVLANYGFRDLTYDVDAIIYASSAMKEAINQVGDKYGLPNRWLNTDFTRTKSFSDKLTQVSVYYKTFSNILTIRTVAGEHLIAMKLVSGREYKNDISDIAGILWEHQKAGKPISFEAVDKTVKELYGDWSKISTKLKGMLEEVYQTGDFESFYKESRKSEKESKKMLLEFQKENPGKLREETTIDEFLKNARKKRNKYYPEKTEDFHEKF